LTKTQKRKYHVIIHAAPTGTAAVGAGLAQLPDSDNVMIVPMQVGMILSLGNVFYIKLTQIFLKTFLANTTATMVGRGISQVLVGWILGLNLLNIKVWDLSVCMSSSIQFQDEIRGQANIHNIHF